MIRSVPSATARRGAATVVTGAALALGLALVPATVANAKPGTQACDNRNNNTYSKLLECVRVEGVRWAYGRSGLRTLAIATHAWFVGWQGDVAFAVFVEKGGASTATAVPAAERFLRALAR